MTAATLKDLINKNEVTVNGLEPENFSVENGVINFTHFGEPIVNYKVSQCDIDNGKVIAPNSFSCLGKNENKNRFDNLLFQFWKTQRTPVTI